MALVINGIDIERIIVNGIECDSVWCNGIQIITPPIEIGNENINSGASAEFSYYTRNTNSHSPSSLLPIHGFDENLVVAVSQIKYPEYAYRRPRCEISNTVTELAKSYFYNSINNGWCVSVSLVNVAYNSRPTVYMDTTGTSNVTFKVHYSRVGINNANYFAVGYTTILGVDRSVNTTQSVQVGDLILSFSGANQSFLWAGAQGIDHGHLASNAATSAFTPRLFEVISSGDIEVRPPYGTANVAVVIGKR